MQTNLEMIKSIAKEYLYMDVIEHENLPNRTHHPILENRFWPWRSTQPDGSMKLLDIIENPDDLNTLREYYSKTIDNSDNIWRIYGCFCKPYYLTFLNSIHQYLSCKDMSELLADAWTTSENPNNDANVSLDLVIKWFKQSDKHILMSESELEYYNSLPNEFTVYRGVGSKSNPNGLSWTQDVEQAVWFSQRFDNDTGYTLSGIAQKENVLAYFNRRDEEEIVINPKTLKNIERT